MNMNNREKRQSLVWRVIYCIQSKQESTTWDFKREWYSKDNFHSLLHDIICMANQVEHEDGLIIIGVDEEKEYEICGVDNDPNRRRTQDIVCQLRDKKFAGGIRPVVHVESFELDSKLIDVIVVENTTNTPFYLTESTCGLFANHIYTRIMDTNTPEDKSADINIVQALWRKRFGLDVPAIDKAFIYLSNTTDWTSIFGDAIHFHKFSPEFVIENEPCEETRNGYEYYMFSQTDSNPRWYYIRIKYHQTILYYTLGLALDGGRFFTPIPSGTRFRSIIEGKTILFDSFTEGSKEHIIHEFYYELNPDGDSAISRRRLYECVPVFHSEKEKEDFLNYASEHFRRDYVFTRPPCEPSFPKTLPTKQMVEVFQQQYKDALILVDMLANYRISQAITCVP